MATAMESKPSFQSLRPGGAAIDIGADGVSVRIPYVHDRPWGLIIGFAAVALVLTGKFLYDAKVHGRSTLGAGVIVGAVSFAILAIVAAIRGGTPPLHVIANSRGLRVRGGVLDETLEWRRDEVLAVSADDLEQPHTPTRRISIVIELRDDEYLVFPLATHEEQAAVVEALRGALKLPPPGAA